MWRIFLLLLIITILYLVLQYLEQNEGFRSQQPHNKNEMPPIINTCPVGTYKYIASDGNNNCCNVEVTGHTCPGNIMCSLTDRNNKCEKHIEKLYNDRAKRFCPQTLTKYYNNNKGSEGCTSGQRKPDWSGLLRANQPHCIIYNNPADILKKSNSCDLVKRLANIRCPPNTIKRDLMEGKIPGCIFKDNTKMFRTCLDRDEFINLSWDKSRSKLTRRQFSDIYKNNGQICDVVMKNYYNKITSVTKKAPPPRPRKLTTWGDVAKLFPYNSNGVAKIKACYASEFYDRKDCPKIVDFVKDNPKDNTALYIKNYCSSMKYKNSICKRILSKW